MSWISLDNAIFISQTFEDSISKILNSEASFDIQKSSSEVEFINLIISMQINTVKTLFSLY